MDCGSGSGVANSLAGSARRTRYLRITGGHQTWAIYATTVILWLLLLLPAAFLNRLFSLDLGSIFDIAAHFPQNIHWMLSPYNGSGRYFPAYWLYHMLLSRLFSCDVVPYYCIQSILFLASALIGCWLFTKVAGAGRIAILFAVSIFVSTPNVETLYTLGKAEPQLYLCLSLILLLFYSLPADKPLDIPKLGVISILFACAIWFKETAQVMFVFGAAGVAVAFAAGPLRRASFPPQFAALFRRYSAFILALALGLGAAKLPYLLFRADGKSAASTYTTYSVTAGLVLKNTLFYLIQQPDVVFFGLLAAAGLLIIWRRRRPLSREADPKTQSDFVFVASLLAMAWAYLGALLIWRWSMAYYLFVPSIIFRFCLGYAMYTIWRERYWTARPWVAVTLGSALLLLYAAVYLFYTGAAQVGYSQVYDAALRSYLAASHQNDRLILESYPFYAEQVANSEELLSAVFHAGRNVTGIADIVNPAVVTNEMRELRLVTDADLRKNEGNWPKKGEYVLDFTGDLLANWQVRGVAPWFSDGSDLRRDGGYDMTVVAHERLYFPALFRNVWTGWPNFAEVSVGYELYRVTEGPRFTWLGRYPDGWMGHSARLTIYPEYVTRAKVYVSTSQYNPQNSVSVYRDDVLLGRSDLSPGKEWLLPLSAAAKDRPTIFRFEVARTFVPRNIHVYEGDTRQLGARIRIESLGRD